MSRIDAQQARTHLDGGALLLDVRTRGEFSSSHLERAVNIPVQELAGRLNELDRKRAVVVYCRSGARSGTAAALLKSKGFEKVYDVGPMHAMQPARASGWGDLTVPLLASLTLGLAPFVPEPHLIGKIRWVAGGAVGMGPMDWFDLVMHGAPVVWLAYTAVRIALAKGGTSGNKSAAPA